MEKNYEKNHLRSHLSRRFWHLGFSLVLAIAALCVPSHEALAQNAVIGAGFGTNNWTTEDCFGEGAGGSRIGTFTANGTGNQFFRLSTCWNFNTNQWGPSSNVNDLEVTIGSPLTGSEVIENNTAKAYYIDVNSTSDNYVFKTRGGGTPPANPDLVVFEVQGAVQTVSSVTRSPSGTVYPSQVVTVTANLSAAFSTGQAVFLRYTTDNFSTSTVVKMSGSGTSYTADIPASANTANANLDYYVFTSGDVASISSANADFFTINLNNNNGSNYEYTVASGWTTSQSGDWAQTSTWGAGQVPPANQPVVANHDLTVAASLTHSGGITVNTGNTLTVASGQTLTLEGGISGAGAVSVNGTLQINAGGFTNIAPTYHADATLTYRSSGSYGRGAEWSTTSGAGYPNHVQISNNTTLQLANGNNAAKSLAGNLTVDNGATLDMQSMTGALTVGGNLTNNGTIFLSLASGGDLAVGGNWTEGASSSRNDSNRAITFNGNTNQTIARTGGGTVAFTYLLINKSAGNLLLSSAPTTDVDVTANAGDVLQLINGGLDLNAQKLTLTASGGNILANGGNRTITGSAGSTLEINGSGGTQKTVTTNNVGTLTIDDNVTITTVNGGVDFGIGLTILDGTLEIRSGGFVQNNFPTYSVGATVAYNTGGNYNPSAEWDNATIQNVRIANGSQVTLNSNRTINGTLTVNGTLQLDADLSLEGDLDNNGTFTHNSGTVTLNGSSAQAITGDVTFFNLTLDNAAGASIANNSTLTVERLLTLTNGNLVTSSANSARLILNATATRTAEVINTNGAVTGDNSTVRQYIQGNFNGEAYRHLSSPVSGVNYGDLSGSGFTLNLTKGPDFNANPADPSITQANAPNLFNYDPSEATTAFDEGWKCPTPTTVIPQGQGMTVIIDRSSNHANAPVELTGTLNNGTISINVSNPVAAPSTNNFGWNLLGNPYPSPLDPAAFVTVNGASGSGTIAGDLYLFKSSSKYGGDFASRSAAGVTQGGFGSFIAPMQAFFARSSVASGTVDFTNAMRPNVFQGPTHLRTEEDMQSEYQGLARISAHPVASPSSRSEVVLILQPGASEGADAMHEANLVAYQGEGSPTIHFRRDADTDQETNLVISALGTAEEADQTISTALYFWSYEGGEHRIELTEANHFTDGAGIYLEDKEANTLHHLGDSAYTFEIAAGWHPGRFVIHLQNTYPKSEPVPTSLEDLAKAGISVAGYQDQVRVNFADLASARADIEVMDMTGRRISQLSDNTQQQVVLDVIGYRAVIVRIRTVDGVYMAKILMNN